MSETEQVTQEISQVQPEAQPQVESPQETTEVQQPENKGTEQPSSNELIARISKFMDDEDSTQAQKIDIDGEKFDINEIEAIQDPAAKEQALKAYKSFQRGYQEKFQELAALRKELEQARDTNKSWTPEKIQSLLNDQEFLSAAQQVAGVTNEEEEDYSSLSDAEKSKLSAMEKELNFLKQQAVSATKAQQDTMLKEKYPNYNPEALDTITNDILQGKREITREDVYRSYSYEKAVQAAYKAGLEDRNNGNMEKIQSMSSLGNNVRVSNDVPAKLENETKQAFAKRIFGNVLMRNK